MLAATEEIKRADLRFHTDISWLKSRHSFSFGSHYDPDNVGHGLLVVSNDDIVAPGSGFDTHPHRDMEIITWVLDGELEHKDSEKNRGVLYPGLAQRMSAGRGRNHRASQRRLGGRTGRAPVVRRGELCEPDARRSAREESDHEYPTREALGPLLVRQILGSHDVDPQSFYDGDDSITRSGGMATALETQPTYGMVATG